MPLWLAWLELDSGTVIAAITVIVLPIAAIAFARSGAAWEGVGGGPFSIEREQPPRPGERPSPAAERAVQETEARQMLEARNHRRRERGERPIDVEAEVRRLLDAEPAAPEADEELRAEVRRLVIAANERRVRRGEQPLDVENETERQLADLVGSG